MHILRTTAFVLLATLLGGCAVGDAFVDRREMDRSIKKQRLPGYDGQVIVCYGGDTPRAERDRLAAEACGVYGLKAVLGGENKWQCRLTVPHRADYHCYDPGMRMADGRLVNPFSSSQVKAWELERREVGRADGDDR